MPSSSEDSAITPAGGDPESDLVGEDEEGPAMDDRDSFDTTDLDVNKNEYEGEVENS
jgi:hypothetical protein